jgi:hypothetical protein
MYNASSTYMYVYNLTQHHRKQDFNLNYQLHNRKSIRKQNIPYACVYI